MRYRRPRRAAGCSKAGRRSAREAQALPRGRPVWPARRAWRPAAPPQDAQRGQARRLAQSLADLCPSQPTAHQVRRFRWRHRLQTARQQTAQPDRHSRHRTRPEPALPHQLRLQFGQLIIFELHEPLQFFQLSLQIIQPIFQLVILTPAGIEAFLSYRKLVTKSLTTIGRAGFGSCRRLPGVSSHKTEVVSGVATGGAAPASVRRVASS